MEREFPEAPAVPDSFRAFADSIAREQDHDAFLDQLHAALACISRATDVNGRATLQHRLSLRSAIADAMVPLRDAYGIYTKYLHHDADRIVTLDNFIDAFFDACVSDHRRRRRIAMARTVAHDEVVSMIGSHT